MVERHVVPYSYVTLGEMSLEQKEFKQAAFYFTKAKSYKVYDWEKILAFRIYSDEFRLDRRTKAVAAVEKK